MITPIRKANTRFFSEFQLTDDLSPLLRDLEQFVQALTLRDEQRRFIRHRWLDHIRWLEDASARAQRRYYTLRLTALIGSALVPILISLDAGAGTPPVITWVTFAVSLVVVMSIALDGLFHYGERWRLYRRTAESLQGEGWKFFELAGSYAAYRTHADAFPAFASNVEQMLNEDMASYVTRVGRETPAP